MRQWYVFKLLNIKLNHIWYETKESLLAFKYEVRSYMRQWKGIFQLHRILCQICHRYCTHHISWTGNPWTDGSLMTIFPENDFQYVLCKCCQEYWSYSVLTVKYGDEVFKCIDCSQCCLQLVRIARPKTNSQTIQNINREVFYYFMSSL